MKLKKKTAMITSFAVGMVMLTTTVFAEVASKSGYEQAKDALKYTAESFSSNLSSYTVDISMAVKDNGKIIISDSSLSKCDRIKGAQENINTRTKGNNKIKNYYYVDKNLMINNDPESDMYYETKFEKPEKGYEFHNPFKEDHASDLEKIGDAIVGNLKDHVIVKDNANGGKELYGSVSEAQIPTLINAITSYMLKSNTASINRNPNEKNPMPVITKDIYIKEVKGKMITDKNGLLQNVLGTGTFHGKDEKGVEHNLTFEVLFKLSNVNSTVVNKLDLSGKKVEKNVQNNRDEFANPEKYIGKYKNDIIIEKDGKFQKIGERILNITKSDDKIVTGNYEEKYLKGYESYAGKLSKVNFEAKYGEDKYNAPVRIEGVSGVGNISINRHKAGIYFDIPQRGRNNILDGGSFNRVFE
ncbi:hypothetical protein K144316041_14100 [Clostridium tetani]|uniref:hypothetical protein n=1 Tax=Clostridium tetani TaxID=1513 RepID=UPI002955BA28|nr:hypothetical protein [Clostridium tetani]BDR72702.1 hypothetical protein K144316041_14100 [Clostridium tetani]